jgi:hypothetical protein
MPMINITERDFLRNKIVTPAWYRVRVEDVGEKTAKSGTSQNYPVEGTILFNADNGSKEFAGVPTPNGWLFNEGAMGFAIGFLNACGAEISEDSVRSNPKGQRIELADAIGKEIDVFIENGTWEGRTVNKINHKYRRPQNEFASA